MSSINASHRAVSSAVALVATATIVVCSLVLTSKIKLKVSHAACWGAIGASSATLLALVAFAIAQGKKQTPVEKRDLPATPPPTIRRRQRLLGIGGGEAVQKETEEDRSSLDKLKRMTNQARLSDAYFLDLLSIELRNQRELCVFPPDLEKMPRLQRLTIRDSGLNALPTSGDWHSLEELILIGNRQLDSLNGIGRFGAIKYLNIDECTIKRLPEELSQLTHLEVLSLSGNPLRHNREALNVLRRMEHLLDLNLARTNLQAVPNAIHQLRELHTLRLAENDLTTLPPFLSSLNLYELDLRYNPNLAATDAVIRILSNCRHLRQLHVEGTQITSAQKEQILNACKRLRLGQEPEPVDPQDPIQIAVGGWKQEAGIQEAWPRAFLDREQEGVFLRWLPRLRNTREYQANKAEFVKTVCAVLKKAHEDKELMDFLLGVASGDLEGCGDRAASSFTDVYTQYLLHTLDAHASEKEVIRIILAHQRQRLLRQKVAQRAEGQYGGSEIVESFLYADIQSVESLQLILPVKTMLFEFVAADWIKRDLPAIQNEILAIPTHHLLNNGGTPDKPAFWHTYLRSRNSKWGVYARLFDQLSQEVMEERFQIEDIDFSNTLNANRWAINKYKELYLNWKRARTFERGFVKKVEKALISDAEIKKLDLDQFIDENRFERPELVHALRVARQLAQKDSWNRNKDRELIAQFTVAFDCWKHQKEYDGKEALQACFDAWKAENADREKLIKTLECALKINWLDDNRQDLIDEIKAGMEDPSKVDLEYLEEEIGKREGRIDFLKPLLAQWKDAASLSVVQKHAISMQLQKFEDEPITIIKAFDEWKDESEKAKRVITQWIFESNLIFSDSFMAVGDQLFADWEEMRTDFDLNGDASKFESGLLVQEKVNFFTALTRAIL